ncbi:M23 family metallopeptidase [Fodinibacter luteus]|uniref:M23 family metallopeptidase n=1 Tax=Fodinibacter luteus TaxID=552064 RepID=UPI0031ED48F3
MSHPAPPTSRYAGRHRASRRAPLPGRVPSAPLVPGLRASSRLPRATAAAFVLAAAGATVGPSGALGPGSEVQAAPASTALDLSAEQQFAVRSEAAAEAAALTDLAQRRQASAMQTAALQGRVEAKQRAARDAKRKAAAARAKKEAAAKAAAKKAAAAKAAAAKARVKAAREGKRWVRPIARWNITSGYGWRWGKTHDGLDVGASTGTPLYAMSRGTVLKAGYFPSFGNKVEIRYWDGTVSWYAHLSRISVSPGERVMPGEVVGAVGNTGNSFGSHLHLEIHPTGGDNPVNPYPWLKRKGLLG